MNATTISVTTVNDVIVAPSEPKPAKKKLKGQDVGIPVRKMGLTYGDEMPTLWFGNNAFLTLLFSGFSANLPEGEEQFVYSVRLFQDKITDPVLQAQVRAFIGQEAHHSREHEALNNTLIARGFRLDRIERRLRSFNQWMRRRLSPAQQLAHTVCGEHMTALMADYALNRPEVLATMAEPVRTTWAWHSIEELEHKAVAFDVYEQQVGDRKLLHRTMRIMLAAFILTNLVNALVMIPRTGQLFNRAMWREAWHRMHDLFQYSAADYRDFFKPDYHPWQHDSRATLTKARAQYLGEGSTEVLS